MARERHADLVLSNARVLTMEPEKPRAEYVALKGGRILGAGDKEQASHFKGPGTRDIDCQGMTLVPGFNDAHCHLMALASSLRGVDCGPDKAGSIAQVVKRIGERAEGVPPGKWIRAFEYDEFHLAERRHPTRWDLDRATPLHPVRLDHRTGHASVLNSRALDLLGISRHTPDPVDGVIERETGGEPTGLLFEMGDYIRRGAGTGTDQDAFLEGIKEANGLLLSVGVTSIQDASPGNDFHRWQTFRSLKETGHLVPRVTVMAGASHLQSFLDSGLDPGLTPGSGDEALRLGAVKVMLGLTTGALHPSRIGADGDSHAGLCESGYQLAFHAVEEEAVEAAANALIEAQKEAQRILPFSNARDRANARHRIEHCSECPPHLVDKLKIGPRPGGDTAVLHLPQRRKVPLSGGGQPPAPPVPCGSPEGRRHTRRGRLRCPRYPSRPPPGHLLGGDAPDPGRTRRSFRPMPYLWRMLSGCTRSTGPTRPSRRRKKAP